MFYKINRQPVRLPVSYLQAPMLMNTAGLRLYFQYGRSRRCTAWKRYLHDPLPLQPDPCGLHGDLHHCGHELQ